MHRRSHLIFCDFDGQKFLFDKIRYDENLGFFSFFWIFGFFRFSQNLLSPRKSEILCSMDKRRYEKLTCIAASPNFFDKMLWPPIIGFSTVFSKYLTKLSKTKRIFAFNRNNTLCESILIKWLCPIFLYTKRYDSRNGQLFDF